MVRHRFRATACAVSLFAAVTVQCGGAVSITAPVEERVARVEAGAPPVDAGPLPPPTEHRPFTMACPVTRPAGLHRDAGLGLPWPKGPCNADSECVPGVNGRCTPNGGVYGTSSCTFDVCFIDDDCADARSWASPPTPPGTAPSTPAAVPPSVDALTLLASDTGESTE